MSSRSTSAPTARPYGRYPPAPEDEPEPAEVTYSRGLPSFGNPNQLRNPPSHYFPSVPASQRKLRRQRSPEPASQQEPVRPSDSSPSNADQPPYDAPSDRADSGEPEDRDEDVEMDVDDDGVKDDAGAAVGGKEEAGPAKKRSRTLTTAHQTAVLNALLAKTRFPSTETREEVGQQIGMSARRVQIWFQNRRQSQKRARDREASEIGGPHPGSQPHSDFLSSDPYSAARYNQRAMPHGQGHSLSRQTSIESMASIASFSSAQTSMSAAARQQYPDRSRPGPSNGYTPYPALSQHWSTGSSAGLPGPVRTYAFPPMPPSKRIDRSYRYRSPEPEVKLPPLMSMLGQPPTGNESPQQQYPPAPPSPTSNVFSHRPPPLTTQRSFNSDRTAQPPSEVASPSSSSTTLPRFDHTEFSRLRISNPPSRYPDDMPQGLDVLDEAMETVYRSARHRELAHQLQ
ncbi:homeobox protein OTX [Pseudohyphozyma bogoriensis]|nr:homeobox protein OTX [Pseudohyphozyma bogoriensis]